MHRSELPPLPPERAAQCLKALACGDALGAATEFSEPFENDIRFPAGFPGTYSSGSPFGFEPGEVTDDTHLTLSGLEALRRWRQRGDPSLQPLGFDVLLSAQRWLKASPPDVGLQTRQSLDTTVPSGGAFSWAHSGGRSAGNGALMRAAAANLSGLSGETLLNAGAVLGAVTHADPRSVWACAAQQITISLLGSRSLAELDTATLGQEVIGLLAGWDAEEALRFIWPDKRTRRQWRALSEAGFEQVQTAVTLGASGHGGTQSGYVIDTLQAGFAALRRAQGGADLTGALWPAVMRGNDADTACCVAGALLGAAGLSVPPALDTPQLRVGTRWKYMLDLPDAAQWIQAGWPLDQKLSTP